MHKGWHSRGYLPHFDAPGLVQGITFRLWDSLPGQVVDLLQQEQPSPAETIGRAEREGRLNQGYGSCYLGIPQIASLVERALFHFDGTRYHLLAWVVMPNHVHVVVELGADHSLGSIVHSWKSYTATQANRILGRRGQFWYADYYDRFVRDTNHLGQVIRYVHENPVKAGLVEKAEEWQYSSARLWCER